MKFEIEGIEIFFPFEKIYSEQLEYITYIIKNITSPGNILIEMASGTGKTVALFSATLSYYVHCKKNNLPISKILYATRTVTEVEKTIEELKRITKFMNLKNFLGIGLTSKKRLCINESILQTQNIDFSCQALLPDCDFYTNVLKTTEIPYGIYNFNDIVDFSKDKMLCPYYLLRKLLETADCVVYTYNYLIDPQIFDIVSKNLPKNTIVILDEAHNIDNYCIEALSFNIKRQNLDAATKNIQEIELEVKESKEEINKKLKDAYMIEIKEKNKECIAFNYLDWEPNKVDLVPGSIRNMVHLVSACKRLVEFYKTKLKTTHLTIENTTSLMNSIKELTFLDRKTLNFLSQRFSYLNLKTNFFDLKKIIDFTTMASLYSHGFKVIFEPFDPIAPSVFNPILRLYCCDASLAISHVFKRFRNVIITSGTLSPIEMYPKILGFTPKSVIEIKVILGRNAISPLIVSKGNDQVALKSDQADYFPSDDTNQLTSSFNLRSEPSVVRNYGSLILELSKIVPDGMVVFFPSYSYMEEIVSLWSESYFINEISKNKLIFVETPSFSESSIALENYISCCKNGRGAILFSVARGKVSEGIDFKYGEGRCVVMIGIPYQYTQSVRLKTRLEFLKTNLGIKENSFLTFDAIRTAAQCLGRVLRSKNDYGLMVLADRRYTSKDKVGKLPKWILNCLEDGNSNLSVDMAGVIAKRYFREMAQEYVEYGVYDEESLKNNLSTF